MPKWPLSKPLEFELLIGCLNQTTKAPKGYSKSARSLHIGTFWKTRFVNPQKFEGKFLDS